MAPTGGFMWTNLPNRNLSYNLLCQIDIKEKKCVSISFFSLFTRKFQLGDIFKFDIVVLGCAVLTNMSGENFSNLPVTLDIPM